MESREAKISPVPDPKERLSLSLAEEVHFMRNILSSLSEEISLLQTNSGLDEKPFLSQREMLFSKLDEIRKRRADELKTLHIDKNWDSIVVNSCELKVLEDQILTLFQKIQDETKILANIRSYPKRAWTLKTSEFTKPKIHLMTEPWN